MFLIVHNAMFLNFPSMSNIISTEVLWKSALITVAIDYFSCDIVILYQINHALYADRAGARAHFRHYYWLAYSLISVFSFSMQHIYWAWLTTVDVISWRVLVKLSTLLCNSSPSSVLGTFGYATKFIVASRSLLFVDLFWSCLRIIFNTTLGDWLLIDLHNSVCHKMQCLSCRVIRRCLLVHLSSYSISHDLLDLYPLLEAVASHCLCCDSLFNILQCWFTVAIARMSAWKSRIRFIVWRSLFL